MIDVINENWMLSDLIYDIPKDLKGITNWLVPKFVEKPPLSFKLFDSPSFSSTYWTYCFFKFSLPLWQRSTISSSNQSLNSNFTITEFIFNNWFNNIQQTHKKSTQSQGRYWKRKVEEMRGKQKKKMRGKNKLERPFKKRRDAWNKGESILLRIYIFSFRRSTLVFSLEEILPLAFFIFLLLRLSEFYLPFLNQEVWTEKLGWGYEWGKREQRG